MKPGRDLPITRKIPSSLCHRPAWRSAFTLPARVLKASPGYLVFPGTRTYPTCENESYSFVDGFYFVRGKSADTPGTDTLESGSFGGSNFFENLRKLPSKTR